VGNEYATDNAQLGHPLRALTAVQSVAGIKGADGDHTVTTAASKTTVAAFVAPAAAAPNINVPVRSAAANCGGGAGVVGAVRITDASTVGVVLVPFCGAEIEVGPHLGRHDSHNPKPAGDGSRPTGGRPALGEQTQRPVCIKTAAIARTRPARQVLSTRKKSSLSFSSASCCEKHTSYL